jgi:hypothetical protein
MKTFKLSIKTAIAGIFMLAVVFQSSAQTITSGSSISIAPSKGDRMDFFLNGDVWETNITHKSKFALKVFISDGRQSVWIQNFSLPETTLNKLMEYIGKLPGIATGGVTKSAPSGTENWVLDSFEIWYIDKDGSIPVNQNVGVIDMYSLRTKIAAFFK